MKDLKRVDRVAHSIQRKLAQIIQQEIKDPRLPNFITIAAVQVTKDLAHAKIYFTSLTGEQKTIEHILNTAAPYLRAALARTLAQRIVPQLHFTYDISIEYAAHLSKLIDKLNDAES